MKYCKNCGAEMGDNDVFCGKCGTRVDGGPVSTSVPATVSSGDETMATIIKVFLVLGCIVAGFTIIALAWYIPMTVSIFHSLNEHRKVSVGMKVCTLIFIGVVPGILLLCSDNL
jgi:uncharacterized membrane protein YvbJ